MSARRAIATPGCLAAAMAIAVLASPLVSGCRSGAGDAGSSGSDAARAEIRAALEAWTRAYNARDAAGTCALFSRDAIAVFPGGTDRDHAAICRTLAAALADRSRTQSYAFDIEEILVSGDLAVVRLIWTLRTSPPPAGEPAAVRERGVDVFRREAEGWRILRSTAYPIAGES